MDGDRSIRGRRILLVAINYAPEFTGPAPYTTNMARYLAAMGADVLAVTGVPHYPSWETPPRYRSGRVFHERDGAVRLLRCRHHVPASMSLAGRALYEGSFLMNGLASAHRFRPDAVLAVSPALADVAIGAAVARRRVPFGVVVQDLVGAGARRSGIEAGRSAASLVSAAELALIRRAHKVAVVSDGFRVSLESAGVPAGRITFLPNYAQAHVRPDDRASARSRLGWDQQSFLAVHTGNMGYKQDLVRLVEAARHLPTESHIRIVIVGDGSLRADVQEAARGATNVDVLLPVALDQYSDVLAASDVLILHEREGVAEMSMPSKLTSYLAAGRPVLAVTSGTGATSQFLRRTGAAVLVDPGCPEATAEALRDLSRPQAGVQHLADAAARYATENLTEVMGLRSTGRFVQDLLGERHA